MPPNGEQNLRCSRMLNNCILIVCKISVTRSTLASSAWQCSRRQ